MPNTPTPGDMSLRRPRREGGSDPWSGGLQPSGRQVWMCERRKLTLVRADPGAQSDGLTRAGPATRGDPNTTCVRFMGPVVRPQIRLREVRTMEKRACACARAFCHWALARVESKNVYAAVPCRLTTWSRTGLHRRLAPSSRCACVSPRRRAASALIRRPSDPKPCLRTGAIG